ncbi:MAG: class I SAM-dependent methyltransferase [Fusicatenibacter sp.]|nr:class I SAM-dependent methyltransferase [Lachnospiraceae bacterium]MDY2938920.1 class I SAM-dependent methyltransferase [Fusicatenibacter sp.]
MDSIDYYERYAIPYYEQTIDLDMTEVMQPFLNALPEGAEEILDLGCGSGRDTKTLEELGYVVTAMDGSEKMCELAEIYTDQEVLHLKFEDMDFDEVFDGIWACESLVHVPSEEIEKIMEKVMDALKPGGILYFSVYEGERDGMYGGRYFCDYTEEEVRELIGRFSRAKILDVWTTDNFRRDADDLQWLNVLVKKRK